MAHLLAVPAGNAQRLLGRSILLDTDSGLWQSRGRLGGFLWMETYSLCEKKSYTV